MIPAGEGFDAVSAGTVEMNYANAYFWTGKLFAGQYFTAVPFGLNFQGFNGWMYDAAAYSFGATPTTDSTSCHSCVAIPACR